MREVHEANLAAAKAAGMSLKDWHEMMSQKGQFVEQIEPATPVILKKTQKYVPQTATEQVLNQLFPHIHSDESDSTTDIS